MSPDAQRIAIAEACGIGDYDTNMNGWHDESIQALPDYLNDLNAMHEAELACIVGNDEHEFNYRCALDTVLGHDRYLIHFATAAQRAEAFLRTIGKWEASK
jgi:hypothetical protein